MEKLSRPNRITNKFIIFTKNQNQRYQRTYTLRNKPAQNVSDDDEVPLQPQPNAV